VVETVRNRQAGFITNFETFLKKKLKYVNTSWRAADNWSEGRQLDSPGVDDEILYNGTILWISDKQLTNPKEL
jgi:hypothetical protein